MKKKLLLLTLVVLGAVTLAGCKIRTELFAKFTADGKIAVSCMTAVDAKTFDDAYPTDKEAEKNALKTFGFNIDNVRYYQGDKYYCKEVTVMGDNYDDAYEKSKAADSSNTIVKRVVKKDEAGNIIRESIFDKDKIVFVPNDYMSEIDPTSTDASVASYAYSIIEFTATEPYAVVNGGTLSNDNKTVTFTLSSDMDKATLESEFYAYTADAYCKEKGHTPEITNKKDATYFAKGYTGDQVCSICGEELEKGKAEAKKVLAKVKIKKATAKSTSISLKWAKVKDASAYEAQIKLGKKWKKQTVSKAKVTFKKLTSKKSYKVRVRAIKTKGSKKATGKWAKKTVKTK